MSLFLAIMADVIYVWTIFSSLVFLPTPATGSLGNWLVQLSLRCVLGLWYWSSRWIGLPLWLSCFMNWLKRCMDRLLSYLCSFLCFLNYLVWLDECKLIIFELEESFKDCFIVYATNEPGPQGFIQCTWLTESHIQDNSSSSVPVQLKLNIASPCPTTIGVVLQRLFLDINCFAPFITCGACQLVHAGLSSIGL